MSDAILIIDDEPDMTAILTASLKLHQYEVVQFNDAPAAMEAIRARPYRLIVTDIMMPDIDGFQLIASTRETATNGSTPILIITAKMLTPEERRSIFDQRCLYLRKPFVPRTLVDMVKKILLDENSALP